MKLVWATYHPHFCAQSQAPGKIFDMKARLAHLNFMHDFTHLRLEFNATHMPYATKTTLAIVRFMTCTFVTN